MHKHPSNFLKCQFYGGFKKKKMFISKFYVESESDKKKLMFTKTLKKTRME